MLITPGDLIPVQPSATTIPWTRRKSQILNYLHRGPVSFSTLVYDTNVGDISALSTYFNPERVSVKDLNSRFGQQPTSGDNSRDDNVKVGTENVVKPRLLLYPEHNLNHTQVKVQRTLKWILSHQEDGDNTDPTRQTDHQEPRADSQPSRPDSLTSLPELRQSLPDNGQGSGRFRFNSAGARLCGADSSVAGQSSTESGTRMSSTESINLTHGSRPMSRPASVAGQYALLTPIGHPLPDSGSSVGSMDSRLDLPTRPATLPNLNSALDSVWKAVPMDGSSYKQHRDTWGVWEPTNTTW